MPPRDALESAARALLDTLAAGTSVRVEAAGNGLVCVLHVRPAGALPPQVRGPAPRRGRPSACRAAVLALFAAQARPLTAKDVCALLPGHGRGTLRKVLADLTRDGSLVNPRDWRGYRLPAWVPPDTPSLF